MQALASQATIHQLSARCLATLIRCKAVESLLLWHWTPACQLPVLNAECASPCMLAESNALLQVSRREKLVLQSDVASGRLPLSIAPLHSSVASPSHLAALLERHR